MQTGIEESTSRSHDTSSCFSNSSDDTGDFECNICFELAQDPIVTLCGHLFCWPCLYKWLHYHSQSQECPVCKALIEEETLVPLYGRGKTQNNPRSKSYPGIGVPNRPAGQRPQTAAPPDANQFANYGFGIMGGFMPVATGRVGNFQLPGFPDATMYGTTWAYPYGFHHGFYGGRPYGYTLPNSRGWQIDVLKYLVIFIGFLVILGLIW